MSQAADTKLFKLLKSTGLSGFHQAKAEDGGTTVKPPFFVYSLDSGGEFGADDTNWAALPRYRVQLVERSTDYALERKVLEALRGEYGYVTVYEDWSESEKARIVSYYLTDKHPE